MVCAMNYNCYNVMTRMRQVYGVMLLAMLSIPGAQAGRLRGPESRAVSKPASATGVQLTGNLAATPRKAFVPTATKGYWNIDVVDDFTLPITKTITFCGAGRNLHVNSDWQKLFKRGFSAIEKSRMTVDECNNDPDHPKPAGWVSRLTQNQRSWILYQQYFSENAYQIQWAKNSQDALNTFYRRPDGDPNYANSLYKAITDIQGSCETFGDCNPVNKKSTFGTIFLDIENEGISSDLGQEQVNLYTYLAKTLKEVVSPQTETASIAPVPVNGHGVSPGGDYFLPADYLWKNTAQHTATSRNRGMPDDIVGTSFSDHITMQMPGVYFVYPDFDYSSATTHTGDRDRHWLAHILQEQEVNMALSPKKRVAWQWLFNTQDSHYLNSGKAEHPAPPAIAEGLAIFYWFTGAHGALFWDDHINLVPNQPTPTDPAQVGIGNDRNYSCYEHYIHGLWRLFKHHGDMFSGGETYLNQNTECSYDGGQTWHKYNANQLKTNGLPFVRAVVKGDQILVAATKPYAAAGEQTSVLLRYAENGYNFVTQINMTGDEIFLGRATMQDPNKAAPGQRVYNLSLISGCNCK